MMPRRQGTLARRRRVEAERQAQAKLASRRSKKLGIRRLSLFTVDRHMHAWSLDPQGRLGQPLPEVSL